jgi:hypothetical protein
MDNEICEARMGSSRHTSWVLHVIRFGLDALPANPRNRRAIIIGGSIATHLGIARGARTPRSAIFEFREFAEVGGLMSYGIDPLVQDPNLQVKAACGFLNVPQLALSRCKVMADEVIE